MMGFLDSLFGSFEKLEARGDLLMREEDFTGAAHAYRAALRKSEKKDPQAAERIRTKADEADDKVIHELIGLVRDHLEDGEPDVAREQLAVAYNFAREHPGEYDTVLEELDRAIDARVESDRRQADIEYEESMQQALRDEDVTQDLIDFEQALNVLSPEDADQAKDYGPHFKKGFLALGRGEIETAVEELELATHERPESAIVYEQWAKALDLAGRSPEARRAYRKSLQRDPRRLEARMSLASTLDTLENKDQQAIELLTEGITESPQHESHMRMAIGAIHLSRGRAEDALEELNRTLQLIPDGTPDLLQMLGSAHEMLGRLDDAENVLRASYASDNRNPARRVRYVEFCLRHGRSLDQAEAALMSMCQSCGFPGDPATMATFSYYTALIIAARGEPRVALESVARAISRGVPPDFRDRFAKLKVDLENKVAQDGA